MKERSRFNFAGNIKHIYISLCYEQPNSSTKKSTEKAQLNAMPKSFYLRFIIFPMGITVKRRRFLFHIKISQNKQNDSTTAITPVFFKHTAIPLRGCTTTVQKC